MPWFVFAYAVGGALMFWFAKDLKHDTNKAYRVAVIWPLVVGWAATWLTLSFGIIIRERFTTKNDLASFGGSNGEAKPAPVLGVHFTLKCL